MDKVATCSKPQFISIKITLWVLRFCLLAQTTGHQNMLSWEQKQANKGNFPLRSVAQERLCLSSVFYTVPVIRIQDASVNFFDIETLQANVISIPTLVWHQYLVLFYEPRKDLEALSYSNKIDKTGYRSCRYY